jgi:hypothetical protein
MVARYSTGESYAEHQLAIGRIITEAEELRAIALRLAEADAEAFAAAAGGLQAPQGHRRGEGRAVPQPSPKRWPTRPGPSAKLIGIVDMVVDLAAALVAIGDRTSSATWPLPRLAKNRTTKTAQVASSAAYVSG